MGFLGIDINKLPHGQELDVLQTEVWFPDLTSASEQVRVLHQPGIKRRLDQVRAEHDAEATIFEINKTVKGPHAKVAGGRPGIVARTSETTFEVHLPIKQHLLDIGTIATHEIQFAPEFVEGYEATDNLGKLAVARAIRAQVTTPSN